MANAPSRPGGAGETSRPRPARSDGKAIPLQAAPTGRNVRHVPVLRARRLCLGTHGARRHLLRAKAVVPSVSSMSVASVIGSGTAGAHTRLPTSVTPSVTKALKSSADMTDPRLRGP